MKLTVEQVRKALTYCPVTGEFTWNASHGRARKGATAGCIAILSGRKYRAIGLRGNFILAHRLAWFHVHGRWPGKDIDHKDGDGLNNSWRNLREATQSENNANSKTRKSVLGFKGVTPGWGGRFKAQIHVNGRRLYLGTYDTAKEARSAYIKEAIKHFGEFARA